MVLDQECPHQVVKKSLSEEDKKEEKSFLPDKILTLKKRSEFLFIRNSGKSHYCKYFIVNYLLEESSSIKIGLTVSKKIGNSVKRNYVKRVIRSIIRNNIKKNSVGVSLEIIPKKNLVKIKYNELEIDLIKAFKNLNI